jgi:SAM-dependent methyltransferase
MLLCPVRDCHQPLVREERRVVCPRGHSFDIARSGYINLLQPQDRRSKQPGDTDAAIQGRRRLHDLGVTQPLLHAIAEVVAPSQSDIVLDAGCGDGFYLGSLARQSGIDAHGVDISVPAVDAAARRYPGCEWIVANADRFVPYADRSTGGSWLLCPGLTISLSFEVWAAIAWNERSRHSRAILPSSISVASLLRPILILPPFKTFCILFTGRCDPSRRKRCA